MSIQPITTVRTTVGWLLLFAAFLATGTRAAAQGAPADTFKVGVLYDAAYRDFGETTAAGAHVDVSTSVKLFDVVGDVGFNHFPGGLVTSFLGGGRTTFFQDGRYHSFVQLLAGVWHSGASGETQLTLQPGFGVDIAMGPRMDFRAQFDLRRIFFDTFADETGLRFSAGITYAPFRK